MNSAASIRFRAKPLPNETSTHRCPWKPRGRTVMSQYADPEVLVDTAWVVAHWSDPNVRVVEVDVDTGGYDQGHIPGAIAWNWTTQLCDTLQRDIIPPGDFRRLMEEAGIANDTTVILYGDNSNWF